MGKCDSTFITGECQGIHLGKFDDCEAEALHEISMGMSESGCGDSDFEGYATLIMLDKYEPVELSDESVVRVTPGYYIVWGRPSGAVVIGRYDTDQAARADYKVHEARYYAWERGCGLDDPVRHAVCVDQEECVFQCQGHENLNGPAGLVGYCDGWCRTGAN